MIFDASDTQWGLTLDADLCIIGGGAAGITMALRLIRSGLNVILLESGGRKHRRATHALSDGDVSDPRLHSPPDRYRRRCLGGSTVIWGGRCVPLDPIDLSSRRWIPDSAWPISYDTLASYYPDANRICEAGEFQYDARNAVPHGMRPSIAGFTPRNFCPDRIERFSRPTNFGTRYWRQLKQAANVRVLINATATRLNCNSDGTRVKSVTVQTLDDNRFTVRASLFVLATGGIEVPRLLLASNDVHANGIGNAEDLVGRFYMCHIAGTLGELKLNLPPQAVAHGYERAEDGTYCRRRLSLRPEMQSSFATGNIAFRLHHPRIPNPDHRTGALSAIYLARRLITPEYAKRLEPDDVETMSGMARHMANVALDPVTTAGFAWHWMRYRILSDRKFPSVIVTPRKNVLSLDFIAEQVPSRDSRIRLTNNVDALGMRKVLIDWRYAPTDVHTVSVAFNLLKEDLAASNVGTLELAEDEKDVESVIRRDGAYGGHHIGTARMGASSTTGVVDANGKVYGVNNLFVAGSAVFPTSGQANPTLTIVALALRLADHLQAEAQAPIHMSTDRPLHVNEALIARSGSETAESVEACGPPFVMNAERIN